MGKISTFNRQAERQQGIGFSKRILELDGLRGLAILLVLVFHYVIVNLMVAPGSPLAYLAAGFRLTWSGVDLFFVLSGFLLGGILLDNRNAPNYFKAFYVRRICRIFPLYYLDVLLFFILLAFVGTKLSPWLFNNPLPLVSYLTFTQNFALAYDGQIAALWLGPTWSLAVEEQFYLVLPLMIRFIPRRTLPYTLLLLILGAIVLRIVLFYSFTTGWYTSVVIMPTRADALMLGVLIAYFLRVPRVLTNTQNQLKWLYGLLAIMAIGMGVLTVQFSEAQSKVMTFVGYTWIALFYGCLLLLGIIHKTGALAAVLRVKWLRGLGDISYGVYLIHMPVLGLFHWWFFGKAPQLSGWQQVVITLTALVFTLVVAKASWLFFEKRVIRLGHSYSYKQQQADKHLEHPLIQRAEA